MAVGDSLLCVFHISAALFQRPSPCRFLTLLATDYAAARDWNLPKVFSMRKVPWFARRVASGPLTDTAHGERTHKVIAAAAHFTDNHYATFLEQVCAKGAGLKGRALIMHQLGGRQHTGPARCACP